MLENIAHLALGFATVLLALEAGQKHEQMRKKQNKHEPSSLSLSFEEASITDHMLFEHIKENFIEHFNQSHVRKKGLRRAVKVWIGKADKVGCALSPISSSTDGSNNSIAARAINTKSQVTTTPATPPQQQQQPIIADGLNSHNNRSDNRSPSIVSILPL